MAGWMAPRLGRVRTDRRESQTIASSLANPLQSADNLLPKLHKIY